MAGGAGGGAEATERKGNLRESGEGGISVGEGVEAGGLPPAGRSPRQEKNPSKSVVFRAGGDTREPPRGSTPHRAAARCTTPARNSLQVAPEPLPLSSQPASQPASQHALRQNARPSLLAARRHTPPITACLG
ncbi:hypothetical protein E2C01_083441 [Portunus trituberculatus]|uniref:Uncharacterized protein n=1 Tax=Portunus trituberculatus TaxID=210409 RepID=A0A5B7J213_PORTR|nr:hypothetical protein [Portunus trituberculatus]